MQNSKFATRSAIATALAFGLGGATQYSVAAEKPEMVKCYGVVKAGKNDCQTATGACAGTSKVDAQGDAWIYIPKGTCKKIVGASRKPQTEDKITEVKTKS